VTAALLAGLVAGYGVAIPVGAVAVLVVSLSARTSLRVGAAAALGVATADGLYALIAVLGGVALAGPLAAVEVPLRWLAGLVLLTMAAHTGYTAIRRHRRPVTTGGAAIDPTTAVRAYAALLTLTLLNPMTIVYFAALVLGRRAAGPAVDTAGPILFVVGVCVASASWQLLLAGGGRLVGRLLTGPRGRLATGLVSSALIAALAVALLGSAGK
jgi:arginine exporter protein ArgO